MRLSVETGAGQPSVLPQPREIAARVAQQIPDFSSQEQQMLASLIEELQADRVAVCVALTGDGQVVLVTPPYDLTDRGGGLVLNRGMDLATEHVRFAHHEGKHSWNIVTAPDDGGRPDITVFQQWSPGLRVVDLGNWPQVKVGAPNLQ